MVIYVRYLTQADSVFFSTIAEISGTLLGITFLALSFSLTNLLHFYRHLALPVLPAGRAGDAHGWDRTAGRAERIDDYHLLDGNPIMVFMAFSVAVTWNLFQFPLVVSLALLSGTLSEPAVLSFIMLLLTLMLLYVMLVRRAQLDRLNAYATREELFLAPVEVAVASACGLAVFGGLFLSIGSLLRRIRAPTEWIQFLSLHPLAVDPRWILLPGLKVLCIALILSGVFFANKDLFAFFKADVCEGIRRRWLRAFVRDHYPRLARSVADLASAAGCRGQRQSPELCALFRVWNDGVPPQEFVEHALDMSVRLLPRGSSRPDYARFVAHWNFLRCGSKSVATWMFDTPGVARWSDSVERRLAETRAALRLP